MKPDTQQVAHLTHRRNVAPKIGFSMLHTNPGDRTSEKWVLATPPSNAIVKCCLAQSVGLKTGFINIRVISQSRRHRGTAVCVTMHVVRDVWWLVATLQNISVVVSLDLGNFISESFEFVICREILSRSMIRVVNHYTFSDPKIGTKILMIL